MFCPQCRVEYRPGFTHCTDCDVDLVHELPENDEDPFCSFWRGDDPRLHAEPCTVLDEKEIPHRTVRRADHLFNLKNYPAFEIGVPFSLFEKAENAVKEAYAMDASSPDAVQSLISLPFQDSRRIQKLPEMLTPSEEENIPGPPDAGVDSEVGSGREVEVWAGEDDTIADMLVASLRESKINVQRKDSGVAQSLFVGLLEEARARKIVKEVVEGEPPE